MQSQTFIKNNSFLALCSFCFNNVCQIELLFKEVQYGKRKFYFVFGNSDHPAEHILKTYPKNNAK